MPHGCEDAGAKIPRWLSVTAPQPRILERLENLEWSGSTLCLLQVDLPSGFFGEGISESRFPAQSRWQWKKAPAVWGVNMETFNPYLEAIY